MFASPGPSQEIVEWLSSLHLSHYASFFHQRGYQSLEDCKDLTEEQLLELKVLPTGHRRRILRSLEALRLKQQSEEEDESKEEGVRNRSGQRKPVPYPRHIFSEDQKRRISCEQPKEEGEYDLEGIQTLRPGAGLGAEVENLPKRTHLVLPQPAPRNPRNIQTSAQTCQCASMHSSSSESLSASEISDWEISIEEPLPSGTNSAPCSAAHGGFQGEMVENSIYEAQPSFNAPIGQRCTRSFILRHRPVPEIPIQTAVPLQDRYCS